jgi:ATP phosphoribosyltransferase regulatory subunit
MITSGSRGALRIAVPKGSLFEGSVRLLEAAGVPVGTLADPGRQLVVRVPGEETSSAEVTETPAAPSMVPGDPFPGPIEYVIGKPTDIPVYVAYGAADVGIAGKDVLVEADVDVVEMTDLGFGACRFVVAEPAWAAGGARERYRHVGIVRVATKYPAIAEAHFARKGIQAEIVRLSGNIEIAPLIGLADQVVDITATGRTLEENDLRIVEEVMPSTARFVANPISLRNEAARVTALATRLSAVASGEDR